MRSITPTPIYSLPFWYDALLKRLFTKKGICNCLIKELSPKSDEKLLDFGFGNGQGLISIHNCAPFTNLSGLEIDENKKVKMLYELAKHGFFAPLNLYDGTHLPYIDNQFDKIYSCLAFHRLSSERKLQNLKEIRRVLKPNGKLVIANWVNAKNIWTEMPAYLFQWINGFNRAKENTPEKLLALMKEAGFDQVKTTHLIDTSIGKVSFVKGIKN